MAHDHAPSSGHPDMDYAEHEKTYAMFTSLAKYVVVAVVIIMVLLAVFTL